MNPLIRLKLSCMMFLEFFIWGAWFVTLGTFLGRTLNAGGLDIANVFSTQSWGAIIAPFIVGIIADRYFNAERIFGLLHLVGAALMLQLYRSESIAEFFPYVLAYMILFMPTLALANSISFRQMTNPEKEFSLIRLWGTIGWIVAGLSISYLFKWDSDQAINDGLLRNTFILASGASALLGLFSFTLPKTPPQKNAEKGQVSLSKLLGLDAIKLLKDRNFLVFFVCSILICIPLAFYYQYANPFLTDTGLENATGKMSIGQMSEALCLLLLPVFFTRFGFKNTILVGMFAWALRYILFAYGNAGELTFMLILGIVLHGICFDFFFVSGQIYTDAKAGEANKSAAQGLIAFATYGVGQLFGFWAAGWISDYYEPLKAASVAEFWKNVWLVPAGFSLLVMVIFAILFKPEKIEPKGA